MLESQRKFLSDNKMKVAALLLSVSAVAGFEGFKPKAYVPVPGDVNTIGYGQTRNADGSAIRPGQVITEPEARKELQREVLSFQDKITNCIKVPLFEYEAVAYTSLAYNIGSSAFCSSTLVNKLNQKDYAGACSEILRWNRFKGEILKGLDNRRKTEYKTCMNIQTGIRG